MPYCPSVECLNTCIAGNAETARRCTGANESEWAGCLGLLWPQTLWSSYLTQSGLPGSAQYVAAILVDVVGM